MLIVQVHTRLVTTPGRILTASAILYSTHLICETRDNLTGQVVDHYEYALDPELRDHLDAYERERLAREQEARRSA